MALKFRLQRRGKRGKPSYKVVVADSRRALNSGNILADVGHYDPMPERSVVVLKNELIAHWYKIGARPSNTVKNLFRINNIAL